MRETSRNLRRGMFAGAAAVAMLLAACGSSGGGSSSNTTAAAGGGGAATTAASGGSAAPTTAAAGGADIKGKTVKVSGSEIGSEADGVIAAFKPFEDNTGAKVQFSGSRDFETQVRVAAEGGNLPDIGFFAQPGLIKDLQSHITPVQSDVETKIGQDYDPYYNQLVTVGGKTLGIPEKADLKSLVWYSPSAFKAGGYQIPQTWDELTALQTKMKADGKTPWCVGIESGDATGWPFTDWIEDIMLRKYGPDVYDQWVAHKIPFNDPKVKDVAQTVGDIWFPDGNVLGGRASIASTGFGNAGLPILDNKCMMMRQGNFYGANLKTAKPDVKLGPDGDASVFYLPTISDQFGKVTLVAGNYAVAFNNKPETLAAMSYIESADYANARIAANKGGFLSPNKNTDPKSYPDPLDQVMAAILIAAHPVRFDGSDQMPGAVGSGTFWKDGTNYVNGTENVDTFLNNVEKSWPAS